jgi:CDP-2,3-bis-(O-geranylgeranyl)-sn-glycerol synthase
MTALMNVLIIILRSIWFILPAYVANPMAVLAHGTKPIDFNKLFIDGQRIFGKGKTWAGFFVGAISGMVFGMIQNTIGMLVPNPVFPAFSQNIAVAIIIVTLLSVGSMTGDLTGSFIKRRLKMESGAEVIGMDQYPFLLVSLLFLYLGSNYFFMRYMFNIIALLTLLIFTPVIHRLVNILGYKIGKKEVPW